MITYNVVGSNNKVTILVKYLKIETGSNDIVTDSFPTKHEDLDLNITLEDKFVDYLVELCEELELKCEMI